MLGDDVAELLIGEGCRGEAGHPLIVASGLVMKSINNEVVCLAEPFQRHAEVPPLLLVVL